MNRFSIIFLLIHLALCLALSFFVLPLIDETFEISITQDEYHLLGYHLASGNGFSTNGTGPSVIRGPGYPAFLSIIYGITGYSFKAVQIAQALLSVLNVYLGYLLIRKLHSEVVARLGMVLMALNPFMAWYTARIMVETLFLTCMLLLFLSSWWLANRPGMKPAIVTGVCLALGAYVKSLVLVLPAALFFILILAGVRAVRSIQLTLVAGLVMVLLIAPWTVRNYVVTDGSVVPVHASLALPLAQSYLYCTNFSQSPLDATPAYKQTNEFLMKITGEAGYEPFHYPLHSLESELRMESAVKEYFAEKYSQDPLLYISHTGIRLLLFWYFSTSPLFSLFWLAINGLLLLFFLGGLASSGPRQARFVMVWVLAFWFLHAAIIAAARFTLPLHPLLLSVALPFLLFLIPGLKRLPFIREADTVHQKFNG